jgi:hypothetical protein
MIEIEMIGMKNLNDKDAPNLFWRE